jgi:hypothetical protein
MREDEAKAREANLVAIDLSVSLPGQSRSTDASWVYQRDWNTSSQSYNRELSLSIANHVLGEDSRMNG